MATRSSGNSTALRRLMTEYRQLTASGLSCSSVVVGFHDPADPSHHLQARPMACSQPVRDAFSSPFSSPCALRDLFILYHTPRSCIRIRLLHLGSPHLRAKRYALRNNISSLFPFLFIEIMNIPPPPPLPHPLTGRRPFFRQIDIRASDFISSTFDLIRFPPPFPAPPRPRSRSRPCVHDPALAAA